MTTTPLGADAADRGSALPRLNLLLITTDDLNFDSMGCMGCPLGATPNLDAFAATSYCFSHTHAAAPICQPSRSAFFTGRVPHRNGATGFNDINADVPTLPEVLGAHGYFTAGINKLGHMTPLEKMGWDFSLFSQERVRDPRSYRQDVAEAIEQAKAAGKPFFLNVNICDPHRPFYGTPDDLARQGTPVEPEFREEEAIVPPLLPDLPDVRREVTQYWNSVRRCDQCFGQIMESLRASGEAARTVVAFIGDHGMAFPFAKTTLYNSGTRTPLMIRHPGLPEATINTRDFVSNVDMMPTLLQILRVPAPADMDGRSLLSLIEGQAQEGRDHVFTWINTIHGGVPYPGRCVRGATFSYLWNVWSNGETKFKNESMAGLTFNAMATAAENDPQLAERVRHFLFRTPEELYDLQNDPWEKRNLIGDATQQDRIKAMRALLLDEMERTDDPLLAQFRAVCLGHV
jgi:N-sulfoglucosamine sulfohydrolase